MRWRVSSLLTLQVIQAEFFILKAALAAQRPTKSLMNVLEPVKLQISLECLIGSHIAHSVSTGKTTDSHISKLVGGCDIRSLI